MPSISFCGIEATGFWFTDILRAGHYRAARLIRVRLGDGWPANQYSRRSSGVYFL